jgi:hypothetical protein
MIHHETFTGADGSALPSPWAVVSTAGTITIQNNRATWVSANNHWYNYGATNYPEWDMTATFSGGTVNAGLHARFVDSTNRYRARFTNTTGQTEVQLARSATQVTGSPVVRSDIGNSDYKLRFRGTIEGASLRLRLRIWKAADPEPTTWDVNFLDTSPLPAGPLGINAASLTSGWVDDWILTDPSAPLPPEPSFDTGAFDAAAFDTGAVAVTPTLHRRTVGILGLVAVRTSDATTVRLRVEPTGTPVTLTSPAGAPATPNAQGDAILPPPVLTAGTYDYRVEMDGVLDTESSVGRLRVWQTGSAVSHTIAFGSCHDVDTPTFTAIATAAPDAFLHLGDLYYADGTGLTIENFRLRAETALGGTRMLSVTHRTPCSFAPDDHDGMLNNSTGGRDPAAWALYNQMYREKIPGQVPASGVYHTFVIGRVRYVMLDCRTFSTDPTAVPAHDDPAKTVLGTTQRAWLLDLIANTPEQVLIVNTGFPWVEAPTNSSRNWGGFTVERQVILDAVATAGKKMVAIAGDMHALAVHTGTVSAANPGGTLTFQGAPLAQTSSSKGGPWTLGPYPASTGVYSRQYGQLAVTDSGSTISVAFTGYEVSAGGVATVVPSVSHSATVLAVTGSGSASFTLTATGTGRRVRPGSGAGTVTLTATGTGRRVARGTGTASLTLSATGTGAPVTTVPSGSGVASLTVTATASGGPVRRGSGAASLSLTATGTGRRVRPGSGAASLTLTATGTGRRVGRGSGTGSLSLTATGTGRRVPRGAGLGSLSLSATGTGLPVTNIPSGGGNATVQLSAVATGRVVRRGGGYGFVALTGTATGRTVGRGTGTASFTLDATGTGWQVISGSGQARLEVTAGQIDLSGYQDIRVTFTGPTVLAAHTTLGVRQPVTAGPRTRSVRTTGPTA